MGLLTCSILLAASAGDAFWGSVDALGPAHSPLLLVHVACFEWVFLFQGVYMGCAGVHCCCS